MKPAIEPLPDYDRLIDERCGILTRIVRAERLPGVPEAYVSYVGDIADSRRSGGWQSDHASLGASFHDASAARRAAIGEAVERYCGNFVPGDLTLASYAELVAAGEPALDPEALALYSPRQYDAPGFPFTRFTRDLRVRWATGRDLMTGDSVRVPASIVYANYFSGPRRTEPCTNFVNYTGIAAGPNRDAAERAALEEVIERDATVLWWSSGGHAPAVRIDSAPMLEGALISSPGTGADAIGYQLVWIKTAFDVPVIGALIEDHELGIVGLGVACRADPLQAALKALAEAVYLRLFSLALLDPGSDAWASHATSRVLTPYRADRRYRDAFRDDFHDMTDLAHHAQIHLDRRMHRHLASLSNPATMNPTATIPLDDVPAVAGPDARAAYIERLCRHGFRPVSVDVTTPDVASAGLCVVRVVVAGLYGNAPAAFPYLGGDRLYEEPVRLGWTTERLTEDTIVRVPLPYA